MTTTSHYRIPIPDDAATVEEEFRRLQQAWELVDTILKTLSDLVAGKAASVHGHPIDQINGLVSALQNKMDASKTFKIGDLTDVVGSADAALNYVLAKNSDGKFSFASALSLLGNHDHTIAQVVGLVNALNALMPKSGGTFTGALSAKEYTVDNGANLDAVFYWKQNNVQRFSTFATGDGSALVFAKYTNVGGYNGPAMQINRSTGFVDIWGSASIAAELYVRAAIELGKMDGTPGPALIDFHTSTTTRDYNARIIATGDVGNGAATLSIESGPLLNNGHQILSMFHKATAADIAGGAANKFPDAAAVRAVVASFLSGNQPYVLNGLGSVAHGLGAKPQKLSSQLVCTTAANGYSAGDEIEMASGTQPWTNNGSFGIHFWADATNVYWKLGLNGLAILQKSNGTTEAALTANWQLRLKAAL